MNTKSLIVLEKKASGRFSTQRYALVSMNPVRNGNPASFNYHVIAGGLDHSGCAAMERSSVNQLTADALLCHLHGFDAPTLVYVESEAFDELKPIFDAPALTYRLAKQQQMAMAS